MSATASQAPGQGLSSAFQSNEGSRHIGSDSLDKLRISNLAKEPNPFEQSFSKSALVKDEAPAPKLTLPSISSLNQGSRLKDESVKLSPIILDPTPYKVQSQAHHSFQTPIHPPISNVQATFCSQPSANGLLASHFSSTPAYPQPSVCSQPPHALAPPYPKPHSYIADGPPIGAVPMDAVSLLANNPNQLINLQPYPGNSLLPPDFKGQIPMIPPSLYSIPTSPKPKRSAGGRKRLPTDGMSPKKIDFLERNRKAALKCRQRKKDEFRRVEESIKLLNLNNSMLTNELQIIGQEAMKLRTLLISHGGCPVAQKAGIMGEATLPLPTQMLLPVSLNGARFQTFQ